MSIADLGGTELDLRFESPSHGSIAVVVAPQARFTESLSSDIQKLGTIDTMIDGFAPEIIGQPLNEGAVEEQTSGKMVCAYDVGAEAGQPQPKPLNEVSSGPTLAPTIIKTLTGTLGKDHQGRPTRARARVKL